MAGEETKEKFSLRSLVVEIKKRPWVNKGAIGGTALDRPTLEEKEKEKMNEILAYLIGKR